MNIGDVIEGKYQLVRLLGEGGMGSVYEACHTRIGHRVALKFLHPELAGKQEILVRFLREARAAAAIGSEHIVQVTDLGETADGTPYLVMEYLDGLDLASVLRQQGPLAPARAAALISQVCYALGQAHDRGIVHRDLKPENLMVTRRSDGSEWVKILDFGIAKFRDTLSVGATGLTATGSTLGTPFYMAPEQLRESKAVDHRADVYSAGVILFELLTGTRPFHADTFGDLIIKVATTDPPPLRSIRPDLDERLEQVILRAMAREPAQRFGSLAELAAALEPWTTQRAAVPATMFLEGPVASAPAAESWGQTTPAESQRQPAFPAPATESWGQGTPSVNRRQPAALPGTIAGVPGQATPPGNYPVVTPAGWGAQSPAPMPAPAASAGPAVVRWVIGIVGGAMAVGLIGLVALVLVLKLGMRDDDPDEPAREIPAPGPVEPVVPAAPGGSTVTMTAHVMSKCPYGVKVLQALTPVARNLGSRFRLDLEYIGRDQDGVLTSMHGEEELLGDKVQLCAHRHGAYDAWLGFLDCQNESWRSIPEGWEQCARGAGLDVDAVRRCFESEEGTTLVRESFAASEKAGARGSPTMFLDGAQYSGGRSEEAFVRAICAAYQDTPPPYCGDIPPPPDVPVTLLIDRRCSRPECDVSGQVRSLKARIPGAKVRELDYSTFEGRELFTKAGLKTLPALLIGREVQEDREAFRSLRGLKRSGDLYVEEVGRFDPVTGVWLERPEVPIRYLVDSRCKTRECASLPRFDTFIKRQVPNARTTTIEYTSYEGRTLWARLSAVWAHAPQADGSPATARREPGLPLALFSKAIEQESEAFSRLQRRMLVIGDEYAFQLGDWDPTGEVCDNEVDDDGDGAADCRDPDCAGTRVCRAEIPRQLRVFVMSQCPYGVQVLNAMAEVLANFGRDRSRIDFRVEFVGSVETDGRLSSMHGQGEVDEDLREICAQHHYGESYAFMDYVLCRNRNIRSSDWEECASGRVRADVIRECAEGAEGRRLLRESFELAQQLGISGSPTWLLNNRYEMNGRTPEDIKTQFCERNPQPGCSNTLSNNAPSRDGNCG